MLEDNVLKIELNNAIVWIRDFVKRTSANGLVIGLSGGKDSAVVLAMAVKAIGKERVLAVSMPCNSNIKDYEDAILVAKKFDVNLINIDLSKTYDVFEKSTNSIIEKEGIGSLSSEAKINTKPRIRMTCLYAIAQSLDYLVIGTGNLCESIVGYTTKWGDNSSDLNPIANFTVSEVLRLGEFLDVPEKILKKAPSDGLSKQTDEEKIGVKYSQIEEMIEIGNTEEHAKEIILKKFKLSRHKRELVPKYQFNRKNYFNN
ncbi:MAG: NAD(+) synthase [Clostridia bacterium]|nr:NAD(+) synthase [Clostridia bacterium]